MDQREPIMQFFKYDHLPAEKQVVSRPFSDLAERLLDLPRNPERTVALRKLLEAKDAAVRASFMVLLAVLLLVPMSAFASLREVSPAMFLGQAAEIAPAPSPVAAMFAQFLTPTGIASAVVTVLGLVGGLLGLSTLRKRQVAIVTQHAFFGVEDFAKTTESTIDDKIAVGLKFANDWMLAQGWRPLSEREAKVVQLGFNALHGSTLVAERAVAPAVARTEAELASARKTAEVPVVPPSP